MSTLRATLADLYTPVFDEMILQTFAEHTQKHKLVYDEVMDSSKDYKTSGMSGLGMWTTAYEGEDGNYEDPVQGYDKTFTQVKYRQRIAVSFEAVDHDEYAMLKKKDDFLEMGRGARAKVERSCAEYLYDGFSTACADGQYLLKSRSFCRWN